MFYDAIVFRHVKNRHRRRCCVKSLHHCYRNYENSFRCCYFPNSCFRYCYFLNSCFRCYFLKSYCCYLLNNYFHYYSSKNCYHVSNYWNRKKKNYHANNYCYYPCYCFDWSFLQKNPYQTSYHCLSYMSWSYEYCWDAYMFLNFYEYWNFRNEPNYYHRYEYYHVFRLPYC